mgnify:CR=1 FL=1
MEQFFSLRLAPLSRRRNWNATRAVAYAGGLKLEVRFKDRTRKRYNHSKKDRPLAVLVCGTRDTPEEFAKNRDGAEKRKDACVGYSVTIALPHELATELMTDTAAAIGNKVQEQYRVPSLWALHGPSKDGDERNYHLHGIFGTRDASGKKVRTVGRREFLIWLRQMTCELIHSALDTVGMPEAKACWDHRSYKTRGITMEPMVHLGPALTHISRRDPHAGIPEITYNETVRNLGAEIEEVEAEIKNYSTLVPSPAEGSEVNTVEGILERFEAQLAPSALDNLITRLEALQTHLRRPDVE